MSYPGADQRMSNYGVKEPNPDEVAGHWKQCCRKEAVIHKTHLSTKGNGTEIWRGIPELSKERMSFYNDKKRPHSTRSTYDQMFNLEGGYNHRLHRDDRQHTVGLDMPSEELDRTVPVRSSTEYGRHVHKPLEEPIRGHVRIERVAKGFYRCRGTGIPSSME